jgi:hypothetical protein
VIALLLLVQLESALGVFPLPPIVRMSGESRTYHGVSIAQLKETPWTHVSVCGHVTLAKHEADGDAHLRLSDGRAFIVAEIVPYHRLPIPKVGQWVRVAGISREDKTHHWPRCIPSKRFASWSRARRDRLDD